MRADAGPPAAKVKVKPPPAAKAKVVAKPNPQVFGPIAPATTALRRPVAPPQARPAPRARVVAPPAGDIASSGAGYGMAQARPTVNRELNAIRVRQAQVEDTKSQQDMQRGAGVASQALRQLAADTVKASNNGVKPHPTLLANLTKAGLVKSYDGYAVANNANQIATLGDKLLSGKLAVGAVRAAEKGANAVGGALGSIPGFSSLASEIPGGGKGPSPASRALTESVDLAANAIPSVYVPLRDAAQGHVGKAVSEVAQPFIQTATHPLQSLEQHPIGTLLLGRGAEGAVGHGLGRVMRATPIDAVKRAGSVERVTRTIPGANVTDTKLGSGDVLAKGARHVARKVVAKVTGAQPSTVMGTKAINRRINEDVQSAKVISAEHEHVAQAAAQNALGRHPTAATTLAAKGVTDATSNDLAAYLREIQAEHANLLTGAERAANERLQAQITKALAGHNDQAVQQAARAYSALRAPQEAQVLEHGLVKPAAAEQARFAGAAVRQGATVAAQRTAVAAGKQLRDQAKKVKVRARQDLQKSDMQVQKALADARVSNVRTNTSPALKVAETEQRQAVRDLARLNRQRRGTSETTITNAAVLRQARTRVRDANAAVVTERARIRGIAPPQADALLNALHERDLQRVARSQAVAEHKAASASLRASRAAPFAREDLSPVSVADVNAARGPGAIEPAFVSESPIARRSAALPSQRVSIPVREMRTGEAVRKGLIDAHPATLVEQSMATSRMLDAANAREKLIESFGYREHPNEPVFTKKTEKSALGEAAMIRDTTGLDWTAMQRQDGRWALVPHDAAAQIARHEQTMPQHPAMRVISSQWRRNVLAFSPRWLTGNVLEAALRSLITGSGPTNYAVGKLALRKLRQTDPAAYEEARARIVGGGNYATAQRVSNERVMAGDLTGFAKAAYHLRTTPGPKQLADAYGFYTRHVFNTLNGRIESQFQTAMLGRALRDHPIMDSRVVRLSSKALQDAADGLRNTDAQVELGRQVDRMYGQYQKFGPGLRNAISTYTPFISWTLNAVNFLYHVLPADHPVMTSLIAASSQATEQWRKQHGLFLDFLGKTPAQLPPWLQGSIPGSAASHLRISRYTPFGLLANDSGTPLGGLPSLVLPQLSEIMANIGGKDFIGNDLSKNPSGARDMLAAVASFLEGQIPAAQQASQLAGLHLPNQRDTKTPATKLSLGQRARKTFDPFVYTPASNKAKKGTKVKGDGWGAPAGKTSTGDGWGAPATTKSGKSSDGWG